jgi:hypothetical protein
LFTSWRPCGCHDGFATVGVRGAWYQIAQAVAEGRYFSAFDACCRCGSVDRSAHWLFDELAYRGRYPELTQKVLEATDGWPLSAP